MLQKDKELNSSIPPLKLDRKVFEELFNALYTPLCRYSIRFVHQAEIAEDIVQEQFISIWDKRDTLVVHTSYKSLLYTAVRNKSIDYLRSKYARMQFVPEDNSFTIQDQSNPLKIVEHTETSEIITKAIKSLPEKCAVVFSLSRFGELSNREVATELNISEKTVENQITNAIKKIKAFVNQYELPIYTKLIIFFMLLWA